MRLFCDFGRHKPGAVPRWNDGYYFTSCRRCGVDLVRTPFEDWRVPEGYRVVWSGRPPQSRPDVALVPAEEEAVAAAAVPVPEGIPVAPEPSDVQTAQGASDAVGSPRDEDSGRRRLPIQDVLAQLDAVPPAESVAQPEAGHEEAAPGRRSAPPPPAAEARPARSWDFMEDDWASTHPTRPAFVADHSETTSWAPGEAVEAETGGRAGSGGALHSLRSRLRSFFSGPEEPNPVAVIAIALAIALAIVAIMELPAFSSHGPDEAPSGGLAASAPGANGAAADPFAAGAGEATVPGPALPDIRKSATTAYVAASLLSCRSAPARQARRVVSLTRGDAVRVVASEGEWLSIVSDHGQCWALSRYVSPERPAEARSEAR